MARFEELVKLVADSAQRDAALYTRTANELRAIGKCAERGDICAATVQSRLDEIAQRIDRWAEQLLEK